MQELLKLGRNGLEGVRAGIQRQEETWGGGKFGCVDEEGWIGAHRLQRYILGVRDGGLCRGRAPSLGRVLAAFLTVETKYPYLVTVCKGFSPY